MCISYNNQSIYYTIFHKESSKLRISEHQYKGDRKPRVKQSGACFTPVTTAELWKTTTYKTMKSNVYYTWSFFYLDATMGQLFKSLTDDFDFYNSNSFCAHFKKEVYNIFYWQISDSVFFCSTLVKIWGAESKSARRLKFINWFRLVEADAFNLMNNTCNMSLV